MLYSNFLKIMKSINLYLFAMVPLSIFFCGLLGRRFIFVLVLLYSELYKEAHIAKFDFYCGQWLQDKKKYNGKKALSYKAQLTFNEVLEIKISLSGFLSICNSSVRRTYKRQLCCNNKRITISDIEKNFSNNFVIMLSGCYPSGIWNTCLWKFNK